MKTEDYLYWGISFQASADPKCAVTARKIIPAAGEQSTRGHQQDRASLAAGASCLTGD